MLNVLKSAHVKSRVDMEVRKEDMEENREIEIQERTGN
jgi:hypothetical protein